ncbi:thioredoxin reductase (NADPH) [Gracilibacillus ureilyticus]|uniref:Ferredoxin--NADP reductase n=1 Tax=Gracilibacillus ureilyticus TaxID=531814 RepID=A0A1H9NJX1_9BACI|nr:NAD(P)/FAD-dependent oxidoreductase [Gracilibacillus ureilyticus]SER36284.1 thioredoxin reductase (NADPH) [Gracilibacillus ureilyticus]
MGEKFDIAIIGGGTTGLFAAYYATMRQLKVVIVEAQEQLGGKVMQFLPEKKIYDVGGYPEISGEDLVRQMIQQAARHEPKILTGESVKQIDRENNQFHLVTEKGKEILSNTVLLATGTGTFHTKRPEEWKELPDSEFKTSVPTTLMDKEDYIDKKVIVASNSKVGVNWALYLSELAESVAIINSEHSFSQVKQEELDQLSDANIDVHYNAKLTDFMMDDKDRLKQVAFLNENEDKVTVPAEKLLTYYGLELEAAPFDKWGIETRKGRIVVTPVMATNVEGIFAAGDIVQYEGKTTLIATGYTEAITAVNHAHLFIDPAATEQLYSTVIYR